MKTRYIIMLVIIAALVIGAVTGCAASPKSPEDETTLRLTHNRITMNADTVARVQVVYTGDDVLRWTSSDEKVLTIAPETGIISAVSPGTAVITCTDGYRNAQCVVTVAEEMDIDAPEITAGQIQELTAGSNGIKNAQIKVLFRESG